MAAAARSAPFLVRVILYELNEVPWRVVDDFVKANPRSNWARLLAQSRTFTSLAPDEGELSPWITWPTFHRGVPNTQHQIAFLGQDPSTFRFAPVWELLRSQGHAIGVFGSLQSWPVPSLGPSDFYVPDTFAKDATCHPRSLSAFQAFNLQNVRENGRVVQSRPSLWQAAVTSLRLLRLGLRMATVLAAARQLAAEPFDRRKAFRRAVFQGRIAFDIFLKSWRSRKPALATFFTNHVAGLQHRYWQAKYPEDFGPDEPALDPFFARAIDYGMKIADRQLGALMRLSRSEGAILMVASSMGQEAVHKDSAPTEEELQLRSADSLARRLGLSIPFHRNLAMEPQVALEFASAAEMERFAKELSRLTDGAGRALFESSAKGTTLSVTVHSPPDVLKNRRAMLREGSRKTPVPLEELGFHVIRPDSPGTAYHKPDGILLVHGPGVVPLDARETVSTLDAAPTILDLFGTPAPAYMTGASLVPRLRTPTRPSGHAASPESVPAPTRRVAAATAPPAARP